MHVLGRPRKPEDEKMGTITINLKQKIIDKITEQGKPKKIIEGIITQMYTEK